MFPTPEDIRPVEGVKTHRDGREICNLLTAAGKREYKRRLTLAWELQRGICPLCGLYVMLEYATPDHIRPRGMGGAFRDDRQDNIQATHGLCNQKKGSRRL